MQQVPFVHLPKLSSTNCPPPGFSSPERDHHKQRISYSSEQTSSFLFNLPWSCQLPLKWVFYLFLCLFYFSFYTILPNSNECYRKIVTGKKLPTLNASDIKVKKVLKNQTKYYRWVQILHCKAQKATPKINY